MKDIDKNLKRIHGDLGISEMLLELEKAWRL